MYSWFDFHVHTHNSFDSLTSIKHIIDAALKIDLSGIAISDHNILSLLSKRTLKKLDSLLIIPAEEIVSDQGEILALFLHEPIESKDSLEIIDLIKEQGGISVLPHPFSGHSLDIIPTQAQKVDIIEVWNARLSLEKNLMALKLARKYSKPMMANSDAHIASDVGKGRTGYLEVYDLDDLQQKMRQAENIRLICQHSSQSAFYFSRYIRLLKERNFIKLIWKLPPFGFRSLTDVIKHENRECYYYRC